MTSTPRVLVVQPDPSAPLDRWDDWLAEDGVATTVVRPDLGEPLPTSWGGAGADALILLGGEMGANDVADHPWLADLRALVVDAVAGGAPTLGLCLGAQVVARALGGRVAVGEAGLECGLVHVAWRPEAAADPLLGGLAAPFPVAAMHGDAVVELPPDAVLLGSTDLYAHQAFVVGGRAWGLQFHPEIGPSTYAAWAAEHHAHGHDDPATLARVDRGTADLEAADDDVRAATRALARRFADLVRGTMSG